jgi:dipeptidyl aminopeptidase/acylaminoacyl peptidase
MRRLIALVTVVATSSIWVAAEQQQPTVATYQVPPQAIVDILDAPPPPTTDLSPTNDTLAVIERASMPPLSELAQPVLRLAGRRINPKTNGPHRAQLSRSITLKSIVDGSERKVTIPQNPALTWIGFSLDGKRFAFTQQRDSGIELWVGDTATGQAKSLTTAQLNASLGTPCQFVGDGQSLLCMFVSPSRGNAPVPPAVPPGPNVQENRGKTAPVRTYQDLLTSAYDEALFDYYASSQLAFVDAASGQRVPVGAPAVFEMVEPSPEGNFIVVGRIRRPYSWLVPYTNFPSTIEVLDRKGAVTKQIAELPMADTVPNGGVLP